MLDVTALVGSGATAIISAMATDAWSWASAEISKLLARDNDARQQDEMARLDAFAADLASMAERDVHNRLHGYLEARLGDDAALRHQFLALTRKICIELGIEPPPQRITQHVNAAHSVVVQTAGGEAHVQVMSGQPVMIRWAAMTGPEAARKLEELTVADAVEALADMEPALAARRLSHVRPAWAKELLSHMDEGLAADLLAKMATPEQAADLLAGVEPAQAAAILDLAVADWAVARLAEMNPDRALILLASMGSKRTENLLAAMERQQTVRLLGAVSKVLAEQARVRTTFDLAQRDAEQIAVQARRKAQETIDKASADADSIRVAARNEVASLRAGAHRAVEPPELAATASTVNQPSAFESRRTLGRKPSNTNRHNGDAVPALAEAAGRGRTDPAVQPPGDVDAVLVLPMELFLISHGRDGRPRIEQGLLETAIFGAALCELVRSGLVAIKDGCPLPTGQLRCADPIGEFLLSTLRDQPARPVEHCARDVRRELFLRVAQQLADSGSVVPMAKSRLLSRSVVRYKPVNEAEASEPAIRLARHLVEACGPPDERTYLLAALVDLTQSHGELPIDLRERQIRELITGLLAARKLSTGLSTVLAGIDRAITSLAMTPRIR